MRPTRLKPRTLIVLVALATLAVGGVEYRRRAARYRALAAREGAKETAAKASAAEWRDELYDAKRMDEMLDQLERAFAEIVAASKRLQTDPLLPEKLKRRSAENESKVRAEWARNARPERQTPHVRKAIADSERRAEHHSRRRAAYLRCARYPWLSPPGDEPEPK